MVNAQTGQNEDLRKEKGLAFSSHEQRADGVAAKEAQAMTRHANDAPVEETRQGTVSGLEGAPAPKNRRRQWTPSLARVEDRPSPSDWELDEPLTLHEAVALLWPQGPVKVATLRAEIHEGRLPFRRIGKAYCVTREGLAVLGRCSLKGESLVGSDRSSVKSLLARHRAGREGIPGSNPDTLRR